ncbi:MAG: M14 family zinc carboxypeptidase, partial [Bacteroidota bacterium]
IILAVGVSQTISAQDPTHSRVRIYTGEQGLRKLSELGIETDHGDIRRHVWLATDLDTSEISKVREAGFKYEIQIADVKKHYREQAMSTHEHSRISSAPNGCQSTNAPSYQVPSNFSLGSYAGYFTYQEMLDNLDQMANLYPNLITLKAPLPGGSTIEGRPVYMVKISDNPNVDESEPEMLYTAVHHAREPGGMSQLIFYMWYLLENQATNPEVAAIIANTELYFIPCLNPDGYLYNEFTDPQGGGLWRKNRRDNLNGSFGVDLNRNYGYNWGFDDQGSSPDGFSETHRGNSPFSEPETQLIRDFVNSRQFKIALNYHTYGNLLIYPWGYDYSIYTPDSALFADYGRILTTYNSYSFGTADQTVGYIVNGSSDDWMYGEQATKPKIFSMTPECGDASFGFWPPANEIIPLCLNTIYQNLTAAQLTGKYASIQEKSPELISTGGGYIKFEVKQLGLDTTGSYTISLSAITPNVFQTGAPVTVTGLSPMQSVLDSISFALVSPMTNGAEIKFALAINNGTYTRTDTIVKYFGNPTVLFASDGNSVTGFNGNQWGISTSVFYSPNASITDSPIGNYNSNDYKTIRTTTAVNLANAVKAKLTFYAKWALEANYDYVQVQASIDNGATWSSLCGNYTVDGGNFQVPGEPLYEGFQTSWVQEEISLDDYIGYNVLVRFVLASDGFLEYDGFYFDDLSITKVLPGTNSIQELGMELNTPSLMPNPASTYSYATFTPQVNESSLEISDMTGRIVMTQPIQDGMTSMRIETSNWKSGVYFVRLKNQNSQSKPAKLVVY